MQEPGLDSVSTDAHTPIACRNGADALLHAVGQAAVVGSSVGTVAQRLSADDWETIADDAEAHRLTPLLHVAIAPCRRLVPVLAMRRIDALALRHQRWHRVRAGALADILAALDEAAIDAIVLKGGALAWTIYPSPWLRPMSDLDILVSPVEASAARDVLVRLGFTRASSPGPAGARAHHLPSLVRSVDGLPIGVEIHVDALSRDTGASIAASNLTETPRPFLANGVRAAALGHIDMLRHLVHHLLEPSWDGRVRLIGAVDVLRYAMTFDAAIDWPWIGRRYPMVINALACLHHVLTLPPSLARFAPPSTTPAPRRAGEVVRPFQAILRSGRAPLAAVRELLDPPPWWLHACYGVPAGRSLASVRFVRHPWRVARSLAVRVSSD